MAIQWREADMSDHVHRPGLWPVSGDGVLERQQDLVLLGSLADGDLLDSLLDALAQTADRGGDGDQLADVLTEVLVSDDVWPGIRAGQPGPAVAAFGPGRGGLSVLVTGSAWTEITTSDGTQRLAAGPPATVLRATIGSPVLAVHAGLGSGATERPGTDRFSRLDRGRVRAGGLSYYPVTAAAPAPPPPAWPAAEPTPPKAAPPKAAPPQAAPPAAPPKAARPEAAPPQAAPPRAAEDLVPDEPAPADGGPPTEFSAVLLGPETSDARPRPPLPVSRPPSGQAASNPAEPMILGVYCKNEHFNDPDARFCAVCGISMNQQTLTPRPGPRPPLGVLVLDDGAVLQLDADYVVGREPTLDAAVASGRARPLRIADAAGTVSRVHAYIQLDDWRVMVTDLGSANGTMIRTSDQAPPRALVPRVPAPLQPGSRVDLGSCGFRYESHRGR
jgi:FHA domain